MTHPVTRSDLEEIDAFYSEYHDAEPLSAPLDNDVSIDQLIAQLEASFAMVSQLTDQTETDQEGLRDMVRNLALRLEDVATELAQINQRLNP